MIIGGLPTGRVGESAQRARHRDLQTRASLVRPTFPPEDKPAQRRRGEETLGALASGENSVGDGEELAAAAGRALRARDSVLGRERQKTRRPSSEVVARGVIAGVGASGVVVGARRKQRSDGAPLPA